MIENKYTQIEIEYIEKNLNKLYNLVKKNKELDKISLLNDRITCIKNILIEFWKKIGINY